MAVYPKAEMDVAELAQQILDGVAGYVGMFPSVNPADLQSALSQFNDAVKIMQASKAKAKHDTEQKNTDLAALNLQVKKALKAAESDSINNPGNLVFIGWGTKSPGTPIVAPSAPSNLRSSNQGPGTITFNWDKPASGGTVRNYSLYRTTVDPEQGLANWTLIDFFYSNEVTIENQPRGTQLYYMVNAANAGGTSPESNTLPVVL